MSPAKGPKGAPRPSHKKSPLRATKSTTLKPTSLTATAGKTLRDKLKIVKDLTEKLWKNKQKLANESLGLNKVLYPDSEVLEDATKVDIGKKNDKKINSKKSLLGDSSACQDSSVDSKKENGNLSQSGETTLMASGNADDKKVLETKRGEPIFLTKNNTTNKESTKLTQKKVNVQNDNKKVNKTGVSKTNNKNLGIKKNIKSDNISKQSDQNKNKNDKCQDSNQNDSNKEVNKNIKGKKRADQLSDANPTTIKKSPKSLDDKKDKADIKQVKSNKAVNDCAKNLPQKNISKKNISERPASEKLIEIKNKNTEPKVYKNNSKKALTAKLATVDNKTVPSSDVAKMDTNLEDENKKATDTDSKDVTETKQNDNESPTTNTGTKKSVKNVATKNVIENLNKNTSKSVSAKNAKKLPNKKIANVVEEITSTDVTTNVEKDKEKLKLEIDNELNVDQSAKKETPKKKPGLKNAKKSISAKTEEDNNTTKNNLVVKEDIKKVHDENNTSKETAISKLRKDNTNSTDKVLATSIKKVGIKKKMDSKEITTKSKVRTKIVKSKLVKNRKPRIIKLDAVKINNIAKTLKLTVNQKKQKPKQTKKNVSEKDRSEDLKQNEESAKSTKKMKVIKLKSGTSKKDKDNTETNKSTDDKNITDQEKGSKMARKNVVTRLVKTKSIVRSPKTKGNTDKRKSSNILPKKQPLKRLKQLAKRVQLTKSIDKPSDGLKVRKQAKATNRVVKTKIGLSNACKLTKIKLKLKSNENAKASSRKPKKADLKKVEPKEEEEDTEDVISHNVEEKDKAKIVKHEENVQTKVEKQVKDVKPKKPLVKPEPSKRLKKLWNAPKGRRVASLNALAKVHCLYENECRSAFELGLLKTTKKSVEKDESSVDLEEVDENPKKISRILRTCAKPSVGKHWDMHELSSTSASSCRSNSSIGSNSSIESDSDDESLKKPIKVTPKTTTPVKNKDKVIVKVKRKRNRLDVTMDLKDMVVRKRMASLNATAILAASYENERKFTRKVGDITSTSSSSSSSVSSSDGSLDDPIYRVTGGTIKSDKNPVKLEPNQNLEVLDSIKKEEEHEVSLIVNQDTDVTITGVYLNTTTRSTLHRRLHHHRTASSSSVSHLHRSRYHISSSSSCSSNGVLLETGTKDVSGTEGSVGGSYTPLGALSSMRPPHQHAINTTTIATGPGSPILVRHASCSSAFSAPPHGRTSNHSAETRTTNCSSSSPGYYQPAGPLITNSHHVTAANHFHHHHHHQSQQHLLVQQSPGNMQPIEPALQPNQQSLDQPVKKLSEDNQEVVYHRTTAALPAQYAQQVLPAHYYPPPPPGGYGDPQGGLCYGPAQYGHAQAVAAAAYYHAARKVYAPPSPSPSGGTLNPQQQNPQNLQVVSQAANLQAVPVPTHDVFRRYVAPTYYQAYTNSGSPGPSVVEYPPPPSTGPVLPPPPGRFYPPAYGAPTGPPQCYGHHQPPSQQRALAYIEPPYQTPCPCPMQTCQSKNAHTGPLIGSEPAADKLSSTLSTSSTQLTCLSAVCQSRDQTVDVSAKQQSVSTSSQAVTVSLSTSSSTSATVACDSVTAAVSNASKNILGVKGPVTNHSLCKASAVQNDTSAGVLDSITSSQQQHVMCFKSEAGAENLSSKVQHPAVPPLMFLPMADPAQVRPQSSPVRDQTTLNNNLLLTNIKVQSDQEVVKPRKPRIGKSMVRNNMLLANNILITAQEHHQDITNIILTSAPASRHHLKHNIISDIDKKCNIIQNDISREDEKEGFEELIKHEIYDDTDIIATDLSIKKCDDVIKQDDDVVVNICANDDAKHCTDLPICVDGVKVCKNGINNIANDKFSSQKQRKKCPDEKEKSCADNGDKTSGTKNEGKAKQDNSKQRKRCVAEDKTDCNAKQRRKSSLEDKSRSVCSESVDQNDRTKQDSKQSKKVVNDEQIIDLTKKVCSENVETNCVKKCANKTTKECDGSNLKQRRKLSADRSDVCSQRTNVDKEFEKPKIPKRKIDTCASDEARRKKCENVKKTNKLSGYKKLIKTIPDKNKSKPKVKRLVKNKSDAIVKPLPKRLKLLRSLNSDISNSEQKLKAHKNLPVKILPKVKSSETTETICNNNNEIPENKTKCKSINKNRKGRPSLSKKQDVLVIPKRSLSNPRWSNGWSWEGEPFKGNVFLNSDEPLVTRTCYPSMRHIEGDQVKPRDCVLLKSGQRKVDLPFVAKVAALWENPEDGEMMMSLLWYYRAEHTEQGNNYFQNHKDEVFASKHKDTNSVACIEDKCYVLTFNEYCRYRKHLKAMEEGIDPKNTLVPLNAIPKQVQISGSQEPTKSQQTNAINNASQTDMTTLLNTAPELILFCRKVYDFRQKRIIKNPS